MVDWLRLVAHNEMVCYLGVKWTSEVNMVEAETAAETIQGLNSEIAQLTGDAACHNELSGPITNGEPTADSDESIYGSNLDQLEVLRRELIESIEDLRERIAAQTGFDPVEHCLTRIKSEESMREKCRRRGLPETTRSALVNIHDALGVRVVCAFHNDVFLVRDYLANLPGFSVYEEKDYIRTAKQNGYRSYHLILRTSDGRAPVGCDVEGLQAGASGAAASQAGPAASSAASAESAEGAEGYFVEVQIRTISMDTWAALEHHLKYKKQAPANERLIVSELKRCADELASTDVSMQALRDLILGEI